MIMKREMFYKKDPSEQILHICNDGKKENVRDQVSVGMEYCSWCGERYVWNKPQAGDYAVAWVLDTFTKGYFPVFVIYFDSKKNPDGWYMFEELEMGYVRISDVYDSEIIVKRILPPNINKKPEGR